MEKENSYKCQMCGGNMVFDPVTQTLKCENCGTEIQIQDDGSGMVEHSLDHRAKNTVKASEKTSRTMKCNGCGAMIEVEANCTSLECPYCGSQYVLADKQADVALPDGVVPFVVEKKEVGNILHKWLEKRWLAPSSLKNLFQSGKMDGIYLPYFTFDAKATATYTGEGGRERVEHYKDSEGHDQTRTHTDWYPTSGILHMNFDDILVTASDKMPKKLLSALTFDTKHVKPYETEYLSGFRSEVLTRDLSDAHKEASDIMQSRLQNEAHNDICTRYDAARNVVVHPTYSDETYRHILMPIYCGSYIFKGKTYTVCLNGQTGSISGEYPKSPLKILFLILFAIILFALLYMFINN